MLRKLIFTLALLSGIQLPVSAGIMNADFSAGATNWVDLSGSGSLQFVQGQAILSTGSGVDALSAVLMQGDDENGLFTFSHAIAVPLLTQFLSFDLMLAGRSQDDTESGSGLFTDSLSLALYSAAGQASDLIFSNLIAKASPQRLQLDISALAGHDIIISFELSDEDDGFNNMFALDNLAFESRQQQVAAPAVMFLMLPALLWLFRLRQRQAAS